MRSRVGILDKVLETIRFETTFWKIIFAQWLNLAVTKFFGISSIDRFQNMQT